MAQVTTHTTMRRLSVFTVTIRITLMLARLTVTMGLTGSSAVCSSVLGRGFTGFAGDSSIGMISSEGGDSEAVSAGVAVGTATVLGVAEVASTAAEADSMVGAADSTPGGADSMVDDVALMEAADFMVEAASTAVEGAASMAAVATVAAASMAVEVMAAATDN